MTTGPAPAVLPTDVTAVNVGLKAFADAVRDQGRPADQLDWRIPAGGSPQAIAALTTLYGDRAAAIDAANAEVFRRLDTGVPMWTAVRAAGDVVPDLDPRTLLHSGPAIEWPNVCDPLQRSMRAATVAEGWAADIAEADAMLRTGKVSLPDVPAARHDRLAVLPEYRASGVGAPLVRFAVAHARAHGGRRMIAQSRGAIRFERSGRAPV